MFYKFHFSMSKNSSPINHRHTTINTLITSNKYYFQNSWLKYSNLVYYTL